MAWQWARETAMKGGHEQGTKCRPCPVSRSPAPHAHNLVCATGAAEKLTPPANIPLTAANGLCACLHASPTCMHLDASACTCIPGHACIPRHVYKRGKRVSARCTPLCSASHARPPCVCTALVCMCTPCTSTCICTYMHIMYQPKHHQRRSSPCRSYSHGAPCPPPRQGASGWAR